MPKQGTQWSLFVAVITFSLAAVAGTPTSHQAVASATSNTQTAKPSAPTLATPRNAKERQIVARLAAAYKAQGLTLTPQRISQALLRLRRMQGAAITAKVLNQATPDASPMQKLATTMATMRQAGGLPAEQTQAPAAAPAASAAMPTSAPSTDQIKAAIAKRAAAAAPTVFTSKPDGFEVAGKHFVDPRGRITTFGGDAATGNVTYFVAVAPGQEMVRFTNVHSMLPPLTVGSIITEGAMQRFTSADGQQVVSGYSIIPAGHSIIVARGDTAFDYAFGQPSATSRSLPDGYFLAKFQHGNVAGTGYVLLRRHISRQEKHNVVKSVTSLFHSVTGSEHNKDYALFDVRTGNTVYLNIAESSEDVGYATNCQRQNAFVNKCRNYHSYASLFDPDGLPNYKHYYWRVAWFPTAHGPTAVVQEHGRKNVDVIRLDTQQRVTAFHRMLGIEDFTVTRNPDGTFKLAAHWSFHDHVVNDIGRLFTTSSNQNPHAGTSTADKTGTPHS